MTARPTSSDFQVSFGSGRSGTRGFRFESPDDFTGPTFRSPDLAVYRPADARVVGLDIGYSAFARRNS